MSEYEIKHPNSANQTKENIIQKEKKWQD